MLPCLGIKDAEPLSESLSAFLAAIQAVVERLKEYLPLSVRQIHYQLLNAPPLWRIVGRSKFNPEYYRYRNDDRSYNALSRLCVSARYAGELPWPAIDDATPPMTTGAASRPSATSSPVRWIASFSAITATSNLTNRFTLRC